MSRKMWSTNRATSFPTSTAARSMVKAPAVCSCGSRMSKSQQAPWKRSRVMRASLGSISTSAHQVWAARRVVAARADGERRVDVEAVEDVGDRVAAVQQTEGPGGLRDRERVRVLVFERVDVVDAELQQHGGASGADPANAEFPENTVVVEKIEGQHRSQRVTKWLAEPETAGSTAGRDRVASYLPFGLAGTLPAGEARNRNREATHTFRSTTLPSRHRAPACRRNSVIPSRIRSPPVCTSSGTSARAWRRYCESCCAATNPHRRERSDTLNDRRSHCRHGEQSRREAANPKGQTDGSRGASEVSGGSAGCLSRRFLHVVDAATPD